MKMCESVHENKRMLEIREAKGRALSVLKYIEFCFVALVPLSYCPHYSIWIYLLLVTHTHLHNPMLMLTHPSSTHLSIIFLPYTTPFQPSFLFISHILSSILFFFLAIPSRHPIQTHFTPLHYLRVVTLTHSSTTFTYIRAFTQCCVRMGAYWYSGTVWSHHLNLRTSLSTGTQVP